jgi:hypothetical protein
MILLIDYAPRDAIVVRTKHLWSDTLAASLHNILPARVHAGRLLTWQSGICCNSRESVQPIRTPGVPITMPYGHLTMSNATQFIKQTLPRSQANTIPDVNAQAAHCLADSPQSLPQLHKMPGTCSRQISKLDSHMNC